MVSFYWVGCGVRSPEIAQGSWQGLRHMPDIVIAFLVDCALGFAIGYGVREQVSRKRRHQYAQLGSI